MKLNKNCKYHDACEINNVRVGELWRWECPRGLRTGKRDFTQCEHYDVWEKSDAVPEYERTANEH